MIDKEKIREDIEAVLRTVHDPELPVNIMELGLVYGINITDDGYVDVTMTLTAPACPVAGEIIREVDTKVRGVEGVSDANVMLTFNPPWTRDLMSDEARLELGFM
ncbi:MAG: DUF59 domain-containing protein [Gemmatimonadaceae bacterium]|nr:DUF59 domain-containing protein [Chitinophagaceae bacterium]